MRPSVLASRSLDTLANRLFACLAALALIGAPAWAQQDDSKRIEIRKITKTCEGDDCPDDNHVVIRLDDQGLDLSTIPGVATLELLRGGEDGENVFFFGGAGGGGYLGVQLVGLTDALRTHFGVPDGLGVMVSEVTDDSAAWRAGIEAGDIITAVDGEKVTSSSSLSRRIRATEPGASVDLEVWREGSPLVITAQVDERESRAHTRAIFLNCDEGEEDCNRVTLRGLDVGCDGPECNVVFQCENGDCTCEVNGEEKDCESLDAFEWQSRQNLHLRHRQQ